MVEKTFEGMYGKTTIKRNKKPYSIITKYHDGGRGYISIPLEEYKVMKELEVRKIMGSEDAG